MMEYAQAIPTGERPQLIVCTGSAVDRRRDLDHSPDNDTRHPPSTSVQDAANTS
jgi:hypothetical protein